MYFKEAALRQGSFLGGGDTLGRLTHYLVYTQFGGCHMPVPGPGSRGAKKSSTKIR